MSHLELPLNYASPYARKAPNRAPLGPACPLSLELQRSLSLELQRSLSLELQRSLLSLFLPSAPMGPRWLPPSGQHFSHLFVK